VHYLEVGKVPPSESVIPGERPNASVDGKEIEHVRKLLPKIANGRKTRHKKQSALSNEQSAKTKKEDAGKSACATQEEINLTGSTGILRSLPAPSYPTSKHGR